jgi:alanyl-tRNA synthetase
LLGLERSFLTEAADSVIDLMKGHYAELVEQRDRIIETLSREEDRFRQTLSLGLVLLGRELDALDERGERELPGDIAFKLYDTHGFPLEITEEVAHERGFSVDRAGFDGAMQRQQEQARQLEVFARKREEDAWT